MGNTKRTKTAILAATVAAMLTLGACSTLTGNVDTLEEELALGLIGDAAAEGCAMLAEKKPSAMPDTMRALEIAEAALANTLTLEQVQALFDEVEQLKGTRARRIARTVLTLKKYADEKTGVLAPGTVGYEAAVALIAGCREGIDETGAPVA